MPGRNRAATPGGRQVPSIRQAAPRGRSRRRPRRGFPLRAPRGPRGACPQFRRDPRRALSRRGSVLPAANRARRGPHGEDHKRSSGCGAPRRRRSPSGRGAIPPGGERNRAIFPLAAAVARRNGRARHRPGCPRTRSARPSSRRPPRPWPSARRTGDRRRGFAPCHPPPDSPRYRRGRPRPYSRARERRTVPSNSMPSRAQPLRAGEGAAPIQRGSRQRQLRPCPIRMSRGDSWYKSRCLRVRD